MDGKLGCIKSGGNVAKRIERMKQTFGVYPCSVPTSSLFECSSSDHSLYCNVHDNSLECRETTLDVDNGCTCSIYSDGRVDC